MRPEDELLGVISDWRRRVDGLAVWSGGEDRLHDLLRKAVWIRAEGARHGVEFVDFPWESLVDRLVQWHYGHPLGTADHSEADVSEAVHAALQSTRIEPLDFGIRTGAFRVRKTGKGAFRVTYRWDVALEVADAHLERQTRPGPAPGPTEAELQWAKGQPKATLNAFAPPIEILQAAMRRSIIAVDAWRGADQEAQLPDDFELGDGLTVGIIAQVLAGLMAMVELGELAHARVRQHGTTLFHAPRDALVTWLTRACEGLSTATAETAINRLMTGPGRSLRTSLLVPNGPVVTVLPLTMFPRAIDPVALRTAATDPARYGSIGQQQGERARAWGQWLVQIPGVKVAERLKMRGPDGRNIAGDLDLLAIDPGAGKGIVLELKWPIDALTLPETAKTDANILDACRQLGRNRRMLRDGEATVKMPPGWPPFSDVEWAWGVGTPQQLHTGPLSEPEMFATSFRYVKSLDHPETIEALANALLKPDVPRLGQHYTVEKMTIQIGRHVVHLDAIHTLDAPWRPQLVQPS
jgi:hypothetical protein